MFDNPKTHAQKQMVLHYGDLADSTCLVKLMFKIKPDEVYNLAAMSHVKVIRCQSCSYCNVSRQNLSLSILFRVDSVDCVLKSSGRLGRRYPLTWLSILETSMA